MRLRVLVELEVKADALVARLVGTMRDETASADERIYAASLLLEIAGQQDVAMAMRNKK